MLSEQQERASNLPNSLRHAQEPRALPPKSIRTTQITTESAPPPPQAGVETQTERQQDEATSDARDPGITDEIWEQLKKSDARDSGVTDEI
jgi:hypothetical protein